MKAREIWEKFKILSFAIILSNSITACSLSFDKNSNYDNFTDTQISDLSDKIIDTDFSDTKEVEELSKDINKYDGFESATLVRVVDGDTIIVEIDNEEYKVRMIGIDTPESVASEEYLHKTGKENTIEGKNASDYTNSLLETGQTIYLQKDISETDKYDRLLRYVWLDLPENINNTDEICSYMVNAILVENGYAIPVSYEPDTYYKDTFEELYEGR